MVTPTLAKPVTPKAAPPGVAVVVPPEPEGAKSCWRRLVRRVDHAQNGAWALDGPSLRPGAAYDLPEGAVVVVVDRHPDRWNVRMTTAQPAGLEDVHTWTLKAALGKRVVDYVARRLPQGSEKFRAAALEALPNRWEGRCRSCRSVVPAQTGWVLHEGSRSVVMHRTGQCPPPPQVITPNRYSGLCMACGCWIGAGQGVAVRRTAPNPWGSMYDPMHTGCPVDGMPGPPNQSPWWCSDCGELAEPGEGYWLFDKLHHAKACPPQAIIVPTWRFRPAPTQPAGVGDVLLARVRIDDAQPAIPQDAPGYRVLTKDYVEVSAVVVETVTTRRGRRHARIRIATATEAEDVLAERTATITEVRPHPAGFKARFQAEKIGDIRPWLAEITGRDPKYGLQRRFLEADQDWTNANSRGTRHVVYGWTLTINRVYEAMWQISWGRAKREFLRATPDGDVVEISREEAEAWLDHAPEWH